MARNCVLFKAALGSEAAVVSKWMRRGSAAVDRFRAIFPLEGPADTRIRIGSHIDAVDVDVVCRIGAVRRSVAHYALLGLRLFHLLGGALLFGIGLRLGHLARR